MSRNHIRSVQRARGVVRRAAAAAAAEPHGISITIAIASAAAAAAAAAAASRVIMAHPLTESLIKRTEMACV
jgi:hypothetical protein